MERHRVMLGNIDPELWAKVKAEAALARKPIAQWVEQVLWEAVEDAEDVRISLERMNDSEPTMSFEEVEEYLKNARAAPPRASSSRSQRVSVTAGKRSRAHSKGHQKTAA
jgi:hypothetical protein